MLIIYFVVLLCSVNTAINIFSQEEGTLDSLRWLPFYDYSEIYYINHYEISESLIYKTLIDSYGRGMEKEFDVLSSPENYISFTEAKVSKIKVLVESEYDKAYLEQGDKVKSKIRGKGKLYGNRYYIIGTGPIIKIIEYDNIKAPIRKSIRAGTLLEANRAINGTKVFLVNSEDKNVARYACAVEDRYLLYSDDEKTIRDMVLSGAGQIESYLDSVEYKYIKDAEEMIGQKWHIDNTKKEFAIFKKYLVERGVEDEKLNGDTEKGIDKYMFSIRTIVYDSLQIVRKIDVYKDEKTAIKKYSDYEKSNLEFEGELVMGGVGGKDKIVTGIKKRARKDNLIITNDVHDEERIRSYAAAYKGYMEGKKRKEGEEERKK